MIEFQMWKTRNLCEWKELYMMGLSWVLQDLMRLVTLESSKGEIGKEKYEVKILI